MDKKTNGERMAVIETKINNIETQNKQQSVDIKEQSLDIKAISNKIDMHMAAINTSLELKADKLEVDKLRTKMESNRWYIAYATGAVAIILFVISVFGKLWL